MKIRVKRQNKRYCATLSDASCRSVCPLLTSVSSQTLIDASGNTEVREQRTSISFHVIWRPVHGQHRPGMMHGEMMAVTLALESPPMMGPR